MPTQSAHRMIGDRVRTIHLSEIGTLTQMLQDRIRESTFSPDLILYIETGARLIAASLHSTMGIPALPIVIRRAGSSTKARYSYLLRSVPMPILDFLRNLERRRSSSTPNVRHVDAAPDVDLSGKRVLVLDDAADSGASLIVARQWAIGRGAVEANIRFATVSVTQPRARELVSFWIYPQLCRFPWSSDSGERQEYLSLYEQIEPDQLAAGNL